VWVRASPPSLRNRPRLVQQGHGFLKASIRIGFRGLDRLTLPLQSVAMRRGKLSRISRTCASREECYLVVAAKAFGL
jgi:hypothetical protein